MEGMQTKGTIFVEMKSGGYAGPFVANGLFSDIQDSSLVICSF